MFCLDLPVQQLALGKRHRLLRTKEAKQSNTNKLDKICFPDAQSDKQPSGPTSKRGKLAAKLTSPLQPPNPSEKGTQLHMRIQYRDLTLEQVLLVS